MPNDVIVSITDRADLPRPWSEQVETIYRVTFKTPIGVFEYEGREPIATNELGYHEGCPVEWKRIRPWFGAPLGADEQKAVEVLVAAHVEREELFREADRQMGDPYP